MMCLLNFKVLTDYLVTNIYSWVIGCSVRYSSENYEKKTVHCNNSSKLLFSIHNAATKITIHYNGSLWVTFKHYNLCTNLIWYLT